MNYVLKMDGKYENTLAMNTYDVEEYLKTMRERFPQHAFELTEDIPNTPPASIEDEPLPEEPLPEEPPPE